MASQCSHKEIEGMELDSPPAIGDTCERVMDCPTCGVRLKVEFIKTSPMVDDIVLSPRWIARTVEKV